MQTKDIYLAAALLSLGAVYEGADRTDPKHMQFRFSPRNAQSDAIPSVAVQDLGAIEAQWVNGTLTVNGPKYAESIKRMKSIVHSS